MLGLNLPETLYCFLKALLATPKRRIPVPSRNRVTGQGKGKPKSGLGFPANINIESMINNTPDITKSHFDAVNICSPSPHFVVITYFRLGHMPGRGKSLFPFWLSRNWGLKASSGPLLRWRGFHIVPFFRWKSRETKRVFTASSISENIGKETLSFILSTLFLHPWSTKAIGLS